MGVDPEQHGESDFDEMPNVAEERRGRRENQRDADREHDLEREHDGKQDHRRDGGILYQSIMTGRKTAMVRRYCAN